MSWAKLDDRANEHHKQLEAGAEACWLWACGLMYANRQDERDGFIPAAMVSMLYPFTNAPNLAERLVSVGLWRKRKGGFVIHNYHKWNQTKEQREAELEAGRERAAKSYAKKRTKNQNSSPEEPPKKTDSSGPSPLHSDSTPTPNQIQTEIAREAAPPVRSFDPLMNPEETVLNGQLLREKAQEPGNAVDHLTKVCKVPRAVIVAELEDFCRYREAGAGMGDKRACWLKHFRQSVLNRHKRGELKPVGAIEHASRKLDNREPVKLPAYRVFKPRDDSQALPPSEAAQEVSRAIQAIGGGRV